MTLLTARAGPRVLTGPDALDRAGPCLDALQLQTGCPVTARRPWQQTWLDVDDARPLVVLLPGRGEQLRAAAVLAVRPGPVARVVAVGDGPSDEVRLPALTPVDADELAAAVIDALQGLQRPWLLVLRHLDPADAAVEALHRRLPLSSTTPGDVSPRLAFTQSRELRAHVSRGHHQQVKRMLKRLERDGLTPQVAHLTTPDEVAAVWPEVERVCRARDLQLRGRTALDDPRDGPFLRQVVARLAARDEVRLTTVRLGDRLAAYVLCFRDGRACRMWNCRVDPAGQEYGLGRVAHDAALREALRDPGCELYDWMRGEEPYKASMSDHAHRAVDLTASSSRVLWAGVQGLAAARGGLRRVRDGQGRGARLVAAATPLLQRLDVLR